MKRIDTSTAEVDKFGTGRNGFTNGDPGLLIPPTQLEDEFFDNIQEEIARAIEGGGVDVRTDDVLEAQLDQVIRDGQNSVSPPSDSSETILSGLRFTTSGVSLDVTLNAGQLVDDGRRYVITDEKLAAASAASFTLPATRDVYFFIAHEDPAGSGDETTVHVENADVAVDAAAPATPAGTFLFARLRTGPAGVTQVLYYSDGPVMLHGGAVGVRLQRPSDTEPTALLPIQGDVWLGLTDNPTDPVPSNNSTMRGIATQELRLQPPTFSPATISRSEVRPVSASTSGSSGTTDIIIEAEADWTDGTAVKVVAHAVAHNVNNDEGSYIGRYDFGAIRFAAGFNLSGSAAAPQIELGVNALANGVTMSLNTIGGSLNLRLVGHSGASDDMEWYLRLEVDIVSPETDNP